MKPTTLTFRQVEEALVALTKVTAKTEVQKADKSVVIQSPLLSARVRANIAINLRKLKSAHEIKEQGRVDLVAAYFGEQDPAKATDDVKIKFQKAYDKFLSETIDVEIRKIPLVHENPKNDETVICLAPTDAPLDPQVIADLLGIVFTDELLCQTNVTS